MMDPKCKQPHEDKKQKLQLYSFGRRAKSETCLSDTVESCYWIGSRVVSQGIARQVVWVVGGLARLKVQSKLGFTK